MKRTFVLDENIIVAASMGSPNAFRLLALMAKNCHKIAVTSELLLSYYSWMHRRERAQLSEVPKLLDQLTHHSEKCVFVPPEELQQDSMVPLRHQKDVFLVRIARAIRPNPALVVLMDKGTWEDINTKTEVTALTLQKAIAYAEQV